MVYLYDHEREYLTKNTIVYEDPIPRDLQVIPPTNKVVANKPPVPLPTASKKFLDENFDDDESIDLLEDIQSTRTNQKPIPSMKQVDDEDEDTLLKAVDLVPKNTWKTSAISTTSTKPMATFCKGIIR